MIFKFTYKTLGGHTHVTVRAGKTKFHPALCGSLAFREEEWEEFKKVLGYNASGDSEVMFEEEK